jgi:Spy/CpxP family protein refolding chaperone
MLYIHLQARGNDMRLLVQEAVSIVMKNKIIRFAGAAVVASGVLFAQAPAPADQTPPSARQRQANRGRMFERFATRLSLTDVQKERSRAIFQSARESSKPVAQQLRQARQALRDAIKSGKSDADIDQLSANVGNLAGQLTTIRTRAFGKVYALLTPSQRTIMDQWHGRAHGMFMGGHEHGQQAGTGS